MRDLDQFRGCMIGGAAGDALGYAVEFLGEEEIFARYGENGIKEYELTDGKALISDDTQMTLFTAGGLLCATTRGWYKGIPINHLRDVQGAYHLWYRTQTEKFPLPAGKYSCWLLNVPELFHRRDPGNTCLTALREGIGENIFSRVNGSKGCGGVMRMAPVGLHFSDWREEPEVIRFGADAAAVTHGHPLGWLTAGVFAGIIQQICQNGLNVCESTKKALEIAREIDWVLGEKELEELSALLMKALDLACNEKWDLDAIHQLGEGWTADECLAIAVYCASKYEDDFEKGIIAAVNHDGDSDSTGAVCGNILGARLGLKGIPEKFITNLELRDVILEVADDLWKASGFSCPLDEPNWDAKYSDGTYCMTKGKKGGR